MVLREDKQKTGPYVVYESSSTCSDIEALRYARGSKIEMPHEEHLPITESKIRTT